MSDDPNTYNYPYRTNYELRILAIWLVAAIACFVSPHIFNVPVKLYSLVGIACVVVGLLLGRNGIEIYIRKSRLKGYPLEFMDANTEEAMKLFGINDKEVIERVKGKR